MINAIGPASLANTTGGGTPTAGLEAQIARYQKELSNCVNCDSANTREGKETIQAISDKISAAKARLEEITAEKSSDQPNTPNAITSADITARKDALASSVNDKIGTKSVSSSEFTNTPVGGRLDVFA